MISLPEAFVTRMAEQLGDELPAFLRSYDEPYTRGIRLNPAKPIAAEALPEGLGDPVPWAQAEGGFYLSVDSTAGATVLHEAGAYYLQEPSAMLPAMVLHPQPGDRVLDLCAAPGGKSTQLAAMLQGEGLLVCNEPVPKRAQVLSRNMERMGFVNTLVVSAMPDRLAQRWPDGFDAIQVDAPCSGEGMFRRHPETRAEWSPESPAGCARRQAEILDNAAKMVRPGGRMVYSTCTLNPVENEDTLTAFCQRHPEFSLRGFSLPGAEAPEGMLTCYPHRMHGEGHFVALLVRAGEGASELPADASLPRPSREQQAALKAFQTGSGRPQTATHVLGETLVYCPECPDVRGLKVLRAGLHLGQLKGKIFAPDHAWAVSVQAPDFPRVSLTEPEARRYLQGETLPAQGRGWTLPTYAGCVLGWGKISDDVMKNHYPKGLRR